mmetsp:Transcript_97669/g.209586  ORF Transcript_97669/g.209586 Transcript_97669/m.209586 type:complete len:247 (-) Transcript_97669:650-1390(-)
MTAIGVEFRQIHAHEFVHRHITGLCDAPCAVVRAVRVIALASRLGLDALRCLGWTTLGGVRCEGHRGALPREGAPVAGLVGGYTYGHGLATNLVAVLLPDFVALFDVVGHAKGGLAVVKLNELAKLGPEVFPQLLGVLDCDLEAHHAFDAELHRRRFSDGILHLAILDDHLIVKVEHDAAEVRQIEVLPGMGGPGLFLGRILVECHLRRLRGLLADAIDWHRALLADGLMHFRELRRSEISLASGL